MAHDVLISYSTKDKLQADAICNRLESQGIRCWIAPRDVPAGSEYADSIVNAIEASQVMVLVYSANADGSKQVRREVERAMSSGITIMPVRIEAAEMSPAFEYYVGSIHWLDAINPPLEEHIDKLAHDLRAVLSRRGGSTAGSGHAPDHGSAGEPQGSPPAAAPPVRLAPVPGSAPAVAAVPMPAPAPQAAPGAGNSRTGVMIGAGLLVAALVGAVVYKTTQPDPPLVIVKPEPVHDAASRDTTVVRDPEALVPAVAGLGRRDATKALQEVGLTVKEIEEAHASIDAPRVIRTEPGAGQKSPSGEVTLVVSGMRIVPSVMGKPVDEARQMLTDKKFTKIEVTEVAVDQAEGTVARMTPAGGERHLASAPVRLEVAAAKPTVPDLAKLPSADAEKQLKDAGFAVTVARNWAEGAEPGAVLKLDPPAGSKLARGGSVTLTVAANGGWVWAPKAKTRKVGDTFRMDSAGTLRSSAPSGAGRGTLAVGQTARIIDNRGDGWVNVVVE
ncbi:MAG: hypothetical protein RL375_4103 [Pseudomonadota bacterium]